MDQPDARLRRSPTLAARLPRFQVRFLTPSGGTRRLAWSGSQLTGTGLLDALVATGLVDSKKAARRAIGDGAVAVNGTKVADENYALGPGDYLHGRVAVLRRGRKNLAAARAS